MTRATRLLAVSLVVVASLAWACGGDTTVGEKIDTKDLGKSATGARLGERATAAPTKAPARTTAPKVAARPTAKPKAAPQGPAITVKIQGDNAAGGSQFDPRIARVARGSVVRWTNVDKVARSVEADGGAFRSPKIAPGGHWDYTAAASGSFNYHDGTRPYAVGTLEVS